MKLRLRARSETLCGFAIPLWRASERESLEQCNKGEYPLIPAAAGSSSYTHNILLLHNAHSLSYRFILISNCLSPLESLSRWEIMRPIKMLYYLHYIQQRHLVYLFHARTLITYIGLLLLLLLQ